ncbi:Hypothetical predicted protein [Mytilus galloprovincialis]|uniref:Uncharacterized protein n=1 Tax=Mytilus galloprovincialis TaxID=29158 RepID=A0A8B6F8Y4_MYTGA|nr:Hypothetical predicted protein [Mytilus galloprovincialis]
MVDTTWLSPERRRSFGLHDQLMTERRREDRHSFVHFLRMPTEMFDEILQGWTSHSQAEYLLQKSTGTRTQVSNYT